MRHGYRHSGVGRWLSWDEEFLVKKIDDPSLVEAVAKALELAELTCPDTMVPKTYYNHLAQAAITAIREELSVSVEENYALACTHDDEESWDEHFYAGYMTAYEDLDFIKGEKQQ